MVEFQLPKLSTRVRFPSPADSANGGITLRQQSRRVFLKKDMFKYLILFFVLVSGFLAGCATTEYRALPLPPQAAAPLPKPQGIYHKVHKGQTLWRIAKAYGVNIEDMIAANNIPHAAAIEVGQLLLIPGAKESQEIAVSHTPAANKDEFIWPMKGRVLSYFNDRHGEGVNRGIDIETNDGDTVRASREGKVILADYLGGYHQTVMIDHGDGFISVYAQNRKLLVKLGDHIYKGDPIAQVGSVTNRSFLHFEIRKGEKATNPLYYLL